MAVLLLEDFETPGYENSWAETIGAGNSIDDAFNGVTPPEGLYSLQSVLAGTNAVSYTDHNLGSAKTTCFATSFLYVDSGSSTADTGQETIFSMRGAVDNVRVQLRYTATRGWHLFFKYYNSGQQSLPGMQGDVNNNLQISTDTFYRLGISYSSDANEITGILWDSAGTIIDQATFTLTNARTDSQVIRIGNVDARIDATELLFDYVQADDAVWPVLPGGVSVSPNNLILSSIILEQTKATPTIIANDLILSSIILGSPIVTGIAYPDDLILSSIILEQASIGGTITPDDLILSSIILESPGVSGIIYPENLILSAIILEQARIIPAVMPDNLILSSIILGQTRRTSDITGPITITMNLSKSNISMILSKPEISMNLKKSNITMELI